MRVFYIKKSHAPSGYFVMDDKGVHIYFKYHDRPGAYPIAYFGSVRLAKKAIQDAYPGSIISKGGRG